MSEIIVRFDLRFSRRAVQGTLAAAMLLAGAAELGSETVTLTTYYPAPSGVYNKMITTADTWLARDMANVQVGTGVPANKLDVNGTFRAMGAATLNSTLYVAGNTAIRMAVDPSYSLSVFQKAQIGSLRIGNNVCTLRLNVAANTSCSANQYATFAPGLYISSYWYQPRVQRADFGGAYDVQVWTQYTNGTGAAWRTFNDKYNSGITFYCCTK